MSGQGRQSKTCATINMRQIFNYNTGSPSGSYGNRINNSSINDEILPLEDSSFYAGLIIEGATKETKHGGFVEIIKIGAPPPKEHLWRSLFLRSPCATFSS